ncbi:MAG: Fpg/Nei family DNA glycosylase [Chloroflexota bacterium]
MPELPEMVNYARQLGGLCNGREIVGCAVERPRSLNLPADEFAHAVTGNRITAIRSYGKHLLFALERGRYLVCHLMLDGYLRYLLPGDEAITRAQVRLDFADGGRLGFHRLHLGHLHVYGAEDPSQIEELADLGPDPLAPGFTPEVLAGVLRGRRGMIKALLMDQGRLAGLGNKYSDEALFAALIRPDRPANAISLDEIDCLHAAIRGTLERAVAAGGGSEHPIWSGDTVTGGARKLFRVYGREGQPCVACGHPLDVRRIGGRNSCFCPVCQE